MKKVWEYRNKLKPFMQTHFHLSIQMKLQNECTLSLHISDSIYLEALFHTTESMFGFIYYKWLTSSANFII